MWLALAPLLVLLLVTVGSAAQTAPPEPAPGEVQRLSEELERLALKNAWVGVERTFQELGATGAPLTFDDWMRGAQSARARGDIADQLTREESSR